VRNVGNATARIGTVTFRVGEHEARGRPDNPVLPRDEITQVRLALVDGDEGYAVAESISLEYKDFSVTIEYADASGEPRGSVSLEVRNGQYPRVVDRGWPSLRR
jgi:hypothetical protein